MDRGDTTGAFIIIGLVAVLFIAWLITVAPFQGETSTGFSDSNRFLEPTTPSQFLSPATGVFSGD